MKKPLFAAVLALFASAALLAQEGVATFKTVIHASGQDMPGTVKLSFSSAGWRSDMHMDTSATGGGKTERSGMGGVHETTMLGKASAPMTAYMVQHAVKSYSVIHLDKTAESTPDETWTVKRTGRSSAGGMSCESATVTSSKGSRVNACISSEFTSSSAWWAAMNRQRNSGWFRAASDAGLKGFPVRTSILKSDGKPEIEMELVSFDRRSVPASTFEIPAGYKEAKAGMGGMTPEQQKMMQERLSKMTPEQRKAYEDAMKRYQPQ